MVRVICRLSRTGFGSILLLVIISCALFSDVAFCDEAAEVLQAQCESKCALADDLWSWGKYDRAKTLYQYVSQNSSDSNLVMQCKVWIAECDIQLGNYSTAEQAIEAIKNDYSMQEGLYPELFTLSDRYWNKGMYDKSKALGEYISQNSPDSNLVFETQMWVLGCEILLGNDSTGDQVFEKLTNDYAQYPNLLKMFYNLGFHCERLGKHDRAETLYQYVVGNYPNSNAALEIQAQVVKSKIKSGNDAAAQQAFDQLCTKYSSAEGFIDQVRRICATFIKENDPAMALPYINRALQASPNHEKTILLLKAKVKCYINMGAETQAGAVVDEIIQNHLAKKKFANTLNEIATIYQKRGNHVKSIELCQKVLDSNPDVSEQLYAHKGIGMSSAWLGDDAKALSKVNLICTNYKDHPKTGYSVFVIGEEYFIQAYTADGKSESQIRDCHEKAIAIWKHNINEIQDSHHRQLAYYYTGRSYQSLKNYHKSLANYHAVLNKYPDGKHAANALFMIGRVHQKIRGSRRIYDPAVITTSIVDPNSVTTTPVESSAVTINSTRAAFELLVEKYPEYPGARYAQKWLSKQSSN